MKCLGCGLGHDTLHLLLAVFLSVMLPMDGWCCHLLSSSSWWCIRRIRQWQDMPAGAAQLAHPTDIVEPQGYNADPPTLSASCQSI